MDAKYATVMDVLRRVFTHPSQSDMIWDNTTNDWVRNNIPSTPITLSNAGVPTAKGTPEIKYQMSVKSPQENIKDVAVMVSEIDKAFGALKNRFSGPGLLDRLAIGLKEYSLPALGAFGLLGAIGTTMLSPLLQAKKLHESKSQMLDKTPALKGIEKERLDDYFNVIKTFAPMVASNPLVAGALINKMDQFEGVDHQIIKDLSAIHNAYSKDNEIINKGITDAFRAFTSQRADDLSKGNY